MRMNDETTAFCDAIQIFCRSPVQRSTADRHHRDDFLSATRSSQPYFPMPESKRWAAAARLTLRFLVQTLQQLSEGPLGKNQNKTN